MLATWSKTVRIRRRDYLWSSGRRMYWREFGGRDTAAGDTSGPLDTTLLGVVSEE
jgi:hypothetical protein